MDKCASGEIVAALMEKGWTRVEARQALAVILDTVSSALVANRPVQLVNIGTLHPRVCDVQYRHPVSGEMQIAEQRRAITIRVSRKLSQPC